MVFTPVFISNSQKMKVVFSISLLFILGLSFAQNSSFIRTYGGSDFNYGKGILALPDTSYIICGNRSVGGSNGSIWLFRVDSAGAFIWEKYINTYDIATVEDITWFNDTSFLICGTVLLNSDYQIYAAKYSIDGEQLWEKVLGTPSWDFGKSLVSDLASNVWVTGYSFPYDTFNTDAVIYKLSGNNGDSLMYVRLDFAYTDKGTYIDTLASSLVLTAQSTDINNDSCISTVLYMDKLLNVKWSIPFGSDSVDYYLRCTGEDSYHRLWVGGGYKNDTSSHESYYFACLDTSGFVIFDRAGGYYGSLYVNRMAINDKSVVYTLGPTLDGYLSFGNSDYGLVIDSSGYGGIAYYGEVQNDYGEDVALATDGGLVMIGSTENYTSNVTSILLIKLDSTHTYNDGDHIHYAHIDENNFGNEISAFPNPSRDRFFIHTKVNYSHFIISNIYGQTIREGDEISNSEIDLSNEANGLYFLSLISKEKIHTIKLLLQK